MNYNGNGNGFPPGGMPPQYQQPQQGQVYQQQPPPGYGQQQIQQPNPYGFQQTQAPGPTGMPPAPPPTGTFHIPNQDMIQSAYQQAAAIKQKIAQGQRGTGNLRFLEISGPNGTKWSAAFVGYTGARAIYLMPSWAPDKMHFISRTKHFWKSAAHPQGTSINGAGEDSLIAKAHKMALAAGNKNAWGRPRTAFVYQGFPYEYDLNTKQLSVNPSQCVHEDGTIRPMLMEVVQTVHAAIQNISDARNFVKVFHPEFGRPLLFSKTKKGPDPKDVEYGVLDLDPQPLAPPFQAGLGYLYALDELFKPATVEEQIQAIMEIGLPMPPEAGGYQGQAQTGYAPTQQGQQPQPQPQPQYQYQQPQPQASYQQYASPPAPNPYQQQVPQQQMQNWPPPPQFQAPQQMQQAGFQPKPLPMPQGQGGPSPAMTPMIPPGQYPTQHQAQPPAQSQQQMLGQPGKPLTPEELQAQLQGGGTPF